MEHNFKFEFSSHLITLLGEELIHDKKIAISELVKNAYDADANEVVVEVSEGCIAICDDGCGMDVGIIKDVWLRPGVSSRKDNIRTRELTPIHKRMPIGEKGIGRLGSHKLGNIIELHTKKNGNDEVYLKIDWRDLENNGNSDSDTPVISVTEHTEPKVFMNNTGTKIVITELKENWVNKDYRDLSGDLTNLISPFVAENDRFKIIFKKDGELFENDLLEEVEEIKNAALFQFEVSIKEGLLTGFQYYFKPWAGLEKVKRREINLTTNKDLVAKIIGKNNKYLSLEKELDRFSDVKIGTIHFQGFIYDYDNVLWNVQTQLPKEKKNKTKKYIKDNGGIRVYRDGFRIFNYGEWGHDILDLDLARVNRPAGKISSNQILASINLRRQDSTDLIEKTNREGFINNKALRSLQKSLNEIINIINVLKQDDKSKIINAYLNNAKDRAGVENKVNDIKQLVNKSNIEDEKKQKINQELDKFAKDFDHTKRVFLSAASTGLNLAMVVHEIRHLTNRLESEINLKHWEKVLSVTKLLQTTVKNYGDIIRLDKKNNLVSIRALVETARFNVELRFETHKVEFITDIPDDLEISVKKNLVMGILNNLFDNSLYWIKEQDIQDKKIYVKAYKKEGQAHLLVADNGLGFTISFESAIMPFVTGRKDESSMGIGLYLTEQVMIAHAGFLVEGDFEQEKLSPEFKDGALIKLIFKQ